MMRCRTELATRQTTQLTTQVTRQGKTTVITVAVAARQSGLTAPTVRRYIRRGLLSEALTEADLAELRRIRRLTGLGINLAGVEVVLQMRRNIKELQAEIDKLVGTTLLALSQGRTELLNHLHGWLFDKVSFHGELDEEQLARYRAANEYAARFCHALRQRLVDDGGAVLSELRRFFRLPMTDKISHIHSQTL